MRTLPQLAALAACVVAGTLAATRADARLTFHATLLKSSPAQNDTLRAAPKTISLWFSERVELSLATVKLTDEKGAAIALAAPTLADDEKAPLVVAIPKAPAAGKYRISWSVAAKDGHASKGTIDFVIRATR